MESAAPQDAPPTTSTAERFLAWLAMPELDTPVHGPARAGTVPDESAATRLPVRRDRRHGRSTRRLAPR